jgi:NAD dependent epimerase/dehydratase family enzyme
MLFLAQNKKCRGIYNLTAPHPSRNAEFGKALAKAMHRPYWAPAPAFLIKWLFGEMSTLVLDGQQVMPNRLTEGGFRFKYEDLDKALKDIYA